VILLESLADPAAAAEGLFLARLPVAALANAAVAAAAFFTRTVSLSGAIGGVVVGTIVWASVGFSGWLVLAAFFAMGSAATKLGYAKKAALGIAEKGEGRRGASNALAKGGVGVAAAALFALTDEPALLVAYVGAFATAVSDTIGSELGQLYGRTPVLVTTLRRVPVGTEGAVSLEGTALGALASLVVALVGYLGGLHGAAGIAWVVIGAFVGTTFESVLGATVEGAKGLGKSGTNFLLTLAGAAVSGGLAALFC
jgi:uncharacterized protein (TIGR00297 family)